MTFNQTPVSKDGPLLVCTGQSTTHKCAFEWRGRPAVLVQHLIDDSCQTHLRIALDESSDSWVEVSEEKSGPLSELMYVLMHPHVEMTPEQRVALYDELDEYAIVALAKARGSK